MKELITQLTKKTGISESQARKAIEMIANFIGDKVPLVKERIQSLLTEKKGGDAPQVGGINVEGLG